MAASSYVGRGFGHVASAAAPSLQLPPPPNTTRGTATAPLPPTWSSFTTAPPPPPLPSDEFPASINDMYRAARGSTMPSRVAADQRSQAASSRRSSAHGSSPPSTPRSSAASSSRHHRSAHDSRRVRAASAYETRSRSDEPRKGVAKEEADDEESFYDYRYIWATGVGLLFVASLYFYWLFTYHCGVVENEETNMTMQYAIDQATRGRLAADVKASVTSVTSGTAAAAATAVGAVAEAGVVEPGEGGEVEGA